MRLSLPSAFLDFVRRASLGLALAGSACAKAPPPVAPGPPIGADPPPTLGTMTEECDALVAALATFKACPNLDDENRDNLAAWIERANDDFAAGRKVTLEPNAQATIALACHRASASVVAATERCHAGPPPRTD